MYSAISRILVNCRSCAWAKTSGSEKSLQASACFRSGLARFLKQVSDHRPKQTKQSRSVSAPC